jgi:type II secretory pathway pseudopilin PulG
MDAVMRGQSGYTLIELLVSVTMTLVMLGTVLQLVASTQSSSQVQPELQDMQQRMRVAVDTLYKALLGAGAGAAFVGTASGSLNAFFPTVVPRRTGVTSADPFDTAFGSRITIFSVPAGAPQTVTSQLLVDPLGPLAVVQQSNCAAGQPLCGFTAGQDVLVFDPLGNFDAFTIASVGAAGAQLQLHGTLLGTAYPAGTPVAALSTHEYYLDPATSQLMHYDGGSAAPSPVVDNVAALAFQYFGDPSPPVRPKPPAGTPNCLYDSAGHYVGGMEMIAAEPGALVPLPLAMFADGPWCGGGTNMFDGDLLRVRRIDVTIRIQTPIASLRTRVPDLTTTFSVAPRNLNLGR